MGVLVSSTPDNGTANLHIRRAFGWAVCVAYSKMAITIEGLLKKFDLNEEDLELEIERKHFLEISHWLTKWRILGLKLEFSEGEVTAIETNKTFEEDRRLEFLKHLKQKSSFKATYGLLLRNLLEIERADDAQHLCIHLKSKFCFDLFTSRAIMEI